MKYFLRILLVFVLAVGVVFGVYYYTNQDAFKKADGPVLTTVSKPAATEKNSNRVLLASIEDEDFYLYKGSKGILLTHGEDEFTFTNWSSMIDAEAPKMYYADFDDDNEKELIIRAVSGKSENSDEYIYDLYFLNPKTDENKNKDFDVTLASRSTWSSIIDNNIEEEMRQLKSCKKIIQFAMIARGSSLTYNKKTGIATNGYTGYVKAIQDNNGKYLTVDKWTKGDGIYTISKDNKILIDIDINISYKDSSVIQNAGKIHFELFPNKNNNFQVTEKTVVFEANEEYRVSNPKTATSENWKYTENNSDTAASNANEVIQWIKYSPDYDPSVFTQTKSYAQETTDINKIESVVITESAAELTAKNGFSFDREAVKKGEYSVIINSGKKDEFDISYTASVKNSGKQEILIINFDKAYPQSEIKTIAVNFGSK